MDRLERIVQHGQSLWLDQLSRPLLTSGELRTLVAERHITGVTSNPTIFAAALRSSDAYDQQLRELHDRHASADRALEEMMATDIRLACDQLRGVWEETGGADGFVSVEVDPRLAHDVEATIADARAWSKRIDRPNLLVKVPATEEGVDAIEELIAEGISINVTLIFSLRRYEEVARAYRRGLERLAGAGGDLSTVTSVASVFVSRIDTAADPRIDAMGWGGAELRGKLGTAVARACLGRFRELAEDPEWRELAGQGARAQRPLWASTSMKDPTQRATAYVERLVAPDTVDTVPLATLEAYAIKGDPDPTPVSARDIEEAVALLHRVADHGLDLDALEEQLEAEGVAKFEASHEELLRTIADTVGT